MRLHDQVKQLEREKQILVNGVAEIKRYLNSVKFSQDINVNKNDILMRLNEIDNDLFCVEVQR